MTMTRAKLSECEIAALAVKAIEAAAHERDEPVTFGRAEVVVTLPEHGQVSCDAACEILDDAFYHFGVVEAKARLTRELEDQAMRWAGHVNHVWVAHISPKIVNKEYIERFSRLTKAGIGVVGIIDGVACLIRGAVFQQADTRLFSKAYFSSDGSIDPVASSAAALRATPARTQWEPLRRWMEYSQQPATWTMVRKYVPEMRQFTAAAARRAIDKGEAIGIGYRGTSITEFFAAENRK